MIQAQVPRISAIPVAVERAWGSTPASIIGVLGISTLAGRWIGGFLLDPFPARLVAVPFFILPAVGCFLLANFGGGIEQAVLAALVAMSFGRYPDEAERETLHI